MTEPEALTAALVRIAAETKVSLDLSRCVVCWPEVFGWW